MEGFVSTGVLTKLLVSHSRDVSQPSGTPHYVQDNMKIYGEELVNLIHNRNAQVFSIRFVYFILQNFGTVV